MATTTTRRVATEDDLRAMPEDGRKYELVDGEIRVSSAGDRHSQIALRLGARLLAFAEERRLGHVFGDLAVEVISPGDRPRHILDKVGEYLEAGVRLVWVIDPRHQRAVVHRSTDDVQKLGRDDFLEGEGLIPGFRVRLGDIL